MIDYENFSEISELPNKRKKISVVRFCEDSDGIIIQDFQYGKFTSDESYFDNLDVDDEILNYKFRKEVWVEEDAESYFEWIWKYAELYRKYDGDSKKVCDIIYEKTRLYFSEIVNDFYSESFIEGD